MSAYDPQEWQDAQELIAAVEQFVTELSRPLFVLRMAHGLTDPEVGTPSFQLCVSARVRTLNAAREIDQIVRHYGEVKDD